MVYFQDLNGDEIKEKIDSIIKEVHEISKRNGVPTGFTIANTKKYYENINIYFPPIRETNHIICGNIIVYTEEQAKEIAEYIDGKVDYILVDAEKKILPSERSAHSFSEPNKVHQSFVFPTTPLFGVAIIMSLSTSCSPNNRMYSRETRPPIECETRITFFIPVLYFTMSISSFNRSA